MYTDFSIIWVNVLKGHANQQFLESISWSFVWRQIVLSKSTPKNLSEILSTGKSLSEALIFALTNPQYDNRLFID